MTDMNQQFLNHFVDKGTGVKDGETWHRGAEKAVGDKLKCREVRVRVFSIWERENAHDCTDECVKLYDRQKKCSALGEAGCRTVCLVSGGDGGDLVRPAALPWSVTSSPGPWYCGRSTKPRRGHREKTQHECGGGTGCVRGCRCEWASAWLREGERQEEKGKRT